MKNRDIYWRRSKIQETLYIGQWHLSSLQSKHLGTSRSSFSICSIVQNTLQNPFLESPSASLSYFPESQWWSEISSFSKVILVWEKTEVIGCQIWAVGGLSHLGNLMFHKKNPNNSASYMMREWACCSDEAASHQLSIVAASWIIWIVSMEECSGLTLNLM